MKKYSEIIKEAMISLGIAIVALGLMYLFGIELDLTRYIFIAIGTAFGWYLIDIIRIKRSR